MTEETKRDLTVITTHVNADFDALASMLAASLLYPGSVAVFPGSQEKGLRDFFVLSTSYMLNLKRPKEIDLDRVERLVLVDTRNKGRVGRLGQLLDGRRKVELHVFDHHPTSGDDISPDLAVVREVGACTTIMFGLLKERGIALDPDQATLLALGIYEDTGSFTFSSTTPEDLKAAAELLAAGANLSTISSLIVRELDAVQVGLLSDLLNHRETLRFGDLEVVIATCSTDSYTPDFAVVAHKLMEMENLNVLFALARMEDRVHVVGRSRLGGVDAGAVCAALGGGGHPSAASATIKNQTLIEVRQRLVMLLETLVSPRRTAREIMSFPVLWVAPEAPFKAAHDSLTRYSINVLLVMEAGRLLGLISRQAVEKALFLGLGEMPVKEYMNPEVVTIPPTATLPEIQTRIVEKRQRILPVVDKGQVLGVITRSDLLNILMKDGPIVPDSLSDSPSHRASARKKNLDQVMQERLPQDFLDLMRELGRVGDELSFNVYAVGGFIRDLLIRRPNLDLDVVVEGSGIKLAQEFGRRHQGAKVRTHDKFGTAVIIFPGGRKIDVATARLEYYESPAALPIVETSSLKLDLYRRDFTINTLAVRLNERHFGVLVDYFSAQRDLKDRRIRVLHSLSLVEDPTRALRAVRFEQRFGFRIGKLTANLIDNAVRINAFARVNPRRLFLELQHILEEANPAPAMARMQGLGLWPAIHPALNFDEAVENLVHQAHTVLNWYDLLYRGERLNRWAVFFLVLMSPLADRQVNEILDRLEMTEKDRQLVLDGRAASRRLLRILLRRPNMRPATIYRLLRPHPLEGLLYTMARGEEEAVRRSFSLYFTELVKVKPSLDGLILQDMGFTPGPWFKLILDAVRDARLNGQVATLEEEREFVRRKFGGERAEACFPPKSGCSKP